MATLLLIIIFIAYIGLGIPDSLLGAAWPAIYQDLSLPISYASIITTVIYIGTIISSFMSGRVLKKLTSAQVSVISTMLTAFALLGFAYSNNIIWFCLCAFPLGIGAGSIDTALNNYVVLNYKSHHINFLHCFYGVGVTLSPFLMSKALSVNNDWRTGYKMMFALQFTIAILLLVSMPVWKKVGTKTSGAQEQAEVLTVFQALKIKYAKACIGVMMGSCAIESTCLIWASTFLVETKSFSPGRAAGIVTLYFVGVTLGRLCSGLIVSKLSSEKVIVIGQIVTFAAIVLLIMSLPVFFVYAGLFLVGFGNGPLFPNMTYLIPIVFGRNVSQSMIGIQMGFSYISIMGAPLLFGVIAQHIGSFMFPYYLLIMYILMIVATIVLMGYRKEEQLPKAESVCDGFDGKRE